MIMFLGVLRTLGALPPSPLARSGSVSPLGLEKPRIISHHSDRTAAVISTGLPAAHVAASVPEPTSDLRYPVSHVLVLEIVTSPAATPSTR